jgi:hypothetical protein
LKIAKGKSESVNRRTDNTMAKGQSTDETHIKHYVHLMNYKYRKYMHAYLINNQPMSPLIPISW